MSPQNRLLLNRLTLNGTRRLQVMLACDPAQVDSLIGLAQSLDGRARYIDRKIGYLRVELPIERLATLVNQPSVDGYQIVTASRSAWYRDGPPRSQATTARRIAQFSVLGPTGPAAVDETLPLLSAAEAREPGYTADEGMGIDAWLREHPTFDGRGVTIAILETAQVDFSEAMRGPAKALDGSPIDKLAGIIDALDPDDGDDTRVSLTTPIEASTTWAKVQGRILILPRPGTYDFGVFPVKGGGNVVQTFGVLRHRQSHEIWVDTDGNDDFSDERPLLGLERKFEVQSLKITQPRKVDLTFIVAGSEDPTRVNIYTGRSLHQTMTMGVAAGPDTDHGLAAGVAPAARVLLVRAQSDELRPSDFIEGYLKAAARPDVDLLDDSHGITFLPDAERDFAWTIFHRLIETYHKPIFHAPSNFEGRLVSAGALAEAFAVGGTISPASYATLFGGGALSETIVHPASPGGPGVDGALKPDFVAPVARIAASACASDAGLAIPKNQPTRRLPACYRISCCTSSSTPYAAGLGALLISAAKQARVDHTYDALARALRGSARFLPNAPAFLQGAGLLNIDGAWRELQRVVPDARITVHGVSQHPLMPYGSAASQGVGIFELEGWTAGAKGTRPLQIHRAAGPSSPTSYRVSWTGNDGTFSSPASVVLPLNQIVTVPIAIAPRTAGIHDAILNLHDPATDAIIVRSMATVIVPTSLESPSHAASFDGRLPVMQGVTHVWNVPANTHALAFDLTVTSGSVGATLAPSTGMVMGYYPAKMPKPLRDWVTPGSHRFVITDPIPGVWSLRVRNDTSWIEPDLKKVSTVDARYTLTVREFDASIRTERTGAAPDTPPRVIVTNSGAPIDTPVLRVSRGLRTSMQGEFNRDGQGNRFEIQVPPGSSSLVVEAKTAGATSARGLDLYLYDCTTGECFSEDFAVQAANTQRLVVRAPAAGRWVAMINGAPAFPASGAFSAEAVVIAKDDSTAIKLERPLASGAQQVVSTEAAAMKKTGAGSVVVYELFDLSAETPEGAEPSPTALAMAITTPTSTRRGVPTLGQ